MQVAFYIGVVERLNSSFGADCQLVPHLAMAERFLWNAYELGASAVAQAVRRREAAAQRLQPSKLWFGATPKAERIRWIEVLAAECVEFLTQPPVGLLIDHAPKPSPPPDIAWMWPPKNVHDAAAWDGYWNDHAAHGFPLTNFFDVVCGVDEVIATLRTNRLSSILCVGSGVSRDPGTLAAAGFEVTVLELSGVAIQFAKLRSGSPPRLRYLEGSLFDDSVAPGPFDVIVERRTLQLFAPTERESALAALARRLATPGVILSHCHDGAGAPGRGSHAARSWFVEQGWPVISRDSVTPIDGRCAWLITSTG